MAFEVHCGKCSARFTLPDDLYDRKVKGRVVTVRCKRCGADISVDGTHFSSHPQNDRPVDETPTVPLASALALAIEGLWVVSYGESDDRELTSGQIKRALANKEIDAETLVWNSSMDEWRSIREVPELAKHLPARDEATGGFLGTGASVTSEVKEPALRRSSRPPPMPSAEESEILGEDEIGPFRSVSAGTLFTGDDTSHGATSKAAAEPTPATRQTGAVVEAESVPPAKALSPSPPRASTSERPEPPPKPSKDLPKAPPKPKPAWLSEPAEGQEEDEEPAPNSGTPDLRSLTTTLKPSAFEPETEPKTKPPEEASEDIFALGGGASTAQLPSINLAALPAAPPPSRPGDDEPPPTRERAKKPGKGGSAGPTAQAQSSPPRAKKGSDKSAVASSSADEGPSSFPTMWLVAAAVAAVTLWFLFLRNPKPADTPSEPTTSREPPPLVTTTTSAAQPSEPAPTETQASAEPAPLDTAPPTQEPFSRATDDKTKPKDEEKPPEKEKEKEKPPEEEKDKEKATSTATTATELAMAPPFDTAAAAGAVASAASAASSCRQEGDPSGTASVSVTFAPSGRVTTANVNGPPFAGTKTGGCIASTLRKAHIPAFTGEPTTVHKTIVIQ